MRYRARCTLRENKLVWELLHPTSSPETWLTFRLAGDMARHLCDDAGGAYLAANRLRGSVRVGHRGNNDDTATMSWELVFEHCGYVLTCAKTGERVATGDPAAFLFQWCANEDKGTEIEFGEFIGECSFVFPRVVDTTTTTRPPTPKHVVPMTDDDGDDDRDHDDLLLFDLFG